MFLRNTSDDFKEDFITRSDMIRYTPKNSHGNGKSPNTSSNGGCSSSVLGFRGGGGVTNFPDIFNDRKS